MVIFVRYVIVSFVILWHLQRLDPLFSTFVDFLIASLIPFILRGSVHISKFNTYQESNFSEIKVMILKRQFKLDIILLDTANNLDGVTLAIGRFVIYSLIWDYIWRGLSRNLKYKIQSKLVRIWLFLACVLYIIEVLRITLQWKNSFASCSHWIDSISVKGLWNEICVTGDRVSPSSSSLSERGTLEWSVLSDWNQYLMRDDVCLLVCYC